MKKYVKSSDDDRLSRTSYRLDDIKYRIDTAVQTTMYKYSDDEAAMNICLDLQTKLYEQFGIDSI